MEVLGIKPYYIEFYITLSYLLDLPKKNIQNVTLSLPQYNAYMYLHCIMNIDISVQVAR